MAVRNASEVFIEGVKNSEAHIVCLIVGAIFKLETR